MCFISHCPSKQQKEATQTQTDVMKFGLSEAKKTLPEARTSLEDPLKFFQALLSGDRSALTSVLGPDINTLTANYETASRSSNEFSPRGGGATAINAEAKFKEAGDIQNLFSEARTIGAAGEADIGKALSSLGLGEVGVSSSASSSLSDTLLKQRQQQDAANAATGQSIGELIAVLAGLGGAV